MKENNNLQMNEKNQNCHHTNTAASGEHWEKKYPPMENESVEPLPESERPRKDGPGGN